MASRDFTRAWKREHEKAILQWKKMRGEGKLNSEKNRELHSQPQESQVCTKAFWRLDRTPMEIGDKADIHSLS